MPNNPFPSAAAVDPSVGFVPNRPALVALGGTGLDVSAELLRLDDKPVVATASVVLLAPPNNPTDGFVESRPKSFPVGFPSAVVIDFVLNNPPLVVDGCPAASVVRIPLPPLEVPPNSGADFANKSFDVVDATEGVKAVNRAVVGTWAADWGAVWPGAEAALSTMPDAPRFSVDEAGAPVDAPNNPVD